MPAKTGGSASTRTTRTARRGRSGRRVPLIAVIGGCGGAGASTLAVSLAVAALGTGRRALLFDADPLGGGLESLVALGTVGAPQISAESAHTWPHGVDPPPWADSLQRADPPRWFDPSRPAEPPRRIDPLRRIEALRNRPVRERGRPEPDLALVTWGGVDGESIPVAAMRNALRVLRSTADLVVVDLPRVVDDGTQLVLAEATRILVIAPVSERAAVATARLLPKVSVVGPRPQLVARLPARDQLTAREFADLLGAPLAGVVRPSRGPLPRPGAIQPLGGRCAASLADFSRRLVERCCDEAAADEYDRTQVNA
jgi:hypothetical protein